MKTSLHLIGSGLSPSTVPDRSDYDFSVLTDGLQVRLIKPPPSRWSACINALSNMNGCVSCTLIGATGLAFAIGLTTATRAITNAMTDDQHVVDKATSASLVVGLTLPAAIAALGMIITRCRMTEEDEKLLSPF